MLARHLITPIIALLAIHLNSASAGEGAEGLITRGNAQHLRDAAVEQLSMPDDGYAEWTPAESPRSGAGSLSLWVKPLWSADSDKSHTIATFRWSGDDASYFALSQGWWEPMGRSKLFLVFSNQNYAFCVTPWEYPYEYFSKQQWTQVVVTWQAGNPGYVSLSVDGKGVCERKIAFPAGRRLQGPVYLGSDLGAGAMAQGRRAQMMLKDWKFSPSPLTPREIWSDYRLAGGSEHSKWMLAATPSTDPSGPVAERRVMYDEDPHWADSKLEIQRRLGRLKAAGFNVYVPCVWPGSYAAFGSKIAPVMKGILDPADPSYDPLSYLVAEAHRQGIAVHAWFYVAGRQPGPTWPDSFVNAAGAFNVHSAEFREFIVSLVSDAAARFDLDGVNLDYIRAIGPCSNPECIEEYRRRYGRDIAQDWRSEQAGETVPSLIEFNRAAVTDIVRRISGSIRRSRPHAIISIDTVPFDHDRMHQGVDDKGWLESHLIDALLDMSYEDPVDVAGVDGWIRTLGADRQVIMMRSYDVFGDSIVDRSGAVINDYVRLIRGRWPGAGVGFYNYPHLSADQVTSLGHDAFRRGAILDWQRQP